MRITILGCGYVGTALARHWRNSSDHQLRLTTTSPERRGELAELADAVHVLEGADAEGLRAALEDSEVPVFSLAPTGTSQVGAEGYEATYLRTFEALERVLPSLPQLRQLIYTGSCSVYGDAGGGWVDETTPPAPRDRHGEILLASERRLQACAHEDRRVAILRLGAIYGPGRELAWAVAGGLEPLRWDPGAAPERSPVNRRIANRRLHSLGYQLRHPRLDPDA